jgi:hypothetical protein
MSTTINEAEEEQPSTIAEKTFPQKRLTVAGHSHISAAAVAAASVLAMNSTSEPAPV